MSMCEFDRNLLRDVKGILCDIRDILIDFQIEKEKEQDEEE